MAHKIIWEENGILVKFSGIVTNEEVAIANDLIYGDIRFETISHQIADYTDATDIQITPFDAKVIGAIDRSSIRWNENKMQNIVVTKDENFIPIVKTYFAAFEGTKWKCKIFETLEMAYAWIKSDSK